MNLPRLQQRRRLRTQIAYLRILGRSFRWTLLGLGTAVSLGALLYAITPHPQLGGRTPEIGTALFAAWMALFAQPVFLPPETWYLALVGAFYPIFGFGLVGEGIVRLGILLNARRNNEKEWMKVMAMAERDHVILCGLGNLGGRILEQLLRAGQSVVAIEKNPEGRYVDDAKSAGVPVLERDAKEDQALVDAGVAHAKTVIVATNDDLANLEIALDVRRLNPSVRIVMRQYDQAIANKIRETGVVDAAFSSSALAAPAVAAMSLNAHVLSSIEVGGTTHVAARIQVGNSGAGRSIAALEEEHGMVVLAHRCGETGTESSPERSRVLHQGDGLVIHVPAERLGTVIAAAG